MSTFQPRDPLLSTTQKRTMSSDLDKILSELENEVSLFTAELEQSTFEEHQKPNPYNNILTHANGSFIRPGHSSIQSIDELAPSLDALHAEINKLGLNLTNQKPVPDQPLPSPPLSTTSTTSLGSSSPRLVKTIGQRTMVKPIIRPMSPVMSPTTSLPKDSLAGLGLTSSSRNNSVTSLGSAHSLTLPTSLSAPSSRKGSLSSVRGSNFPYSHTRADSLPSNLRKQVHVPSPPRLQIHTTHAMGTRVSDSTTDDEADEADQRRRKGSREKAANTRTSSNSNRNSINNNNGNNDDGLAGYNATHNYDAAKRQTGGEEGGAGGLYTYDNSSNDTVTTDEMITSEDIIQHRNGKEQQQKKTKPPQSPKKPSIHTKSSSSSTTATASSFSTFGGGQPAPTSSHSSGSSSTNSPNPNVITQEPEVFDARTQASTVVAMARSRSLKKVDRSRSRSGSGSGSGSGLGSVSGSIKRPAGPTRDATFGEDPHFADVEDHDRMRMRTQDRLMSVKEDDEGEIRREIDASGASVVMQQQNRLGGESEKHRETEREKEKEEEYKKTVPIFQRTNTSELKSFSDKIFDHTRANEEKIRIALQKLQEANIKRVTTRIYIADMINFKTMQITSLQTTAMLMEHLKGKGLIPEEEDWALFELVSSLNVERPLRDWEIVVDIVANWDPDKNNILLAKKYAFCSSLTPESVVVNSYPKLYGWLHFEHKKGKWQKRFFYLKGAMIFYSKDTRGTHETQLCSLHTFDVYTFSHPLKKAPLKFQFALKSQDRIRIFENVDDYMHSFCVESGEKMKEWVLGIRHARSHLQQEKYPERVKEPLAPIELPKIPEKIIEGTLVNLELHSKQSVNKLPPQHIDVVTSKNAVDNQIVTSPVELSAPISSVVPPLRPKKSIKRVDAALIIDRNIDDMKSDNASSTSPMASERFLPSPSSSDRVMSPQSPSSKDHDSDNVSVSSKRSKKNSQASSIETPKSSRSTDYTPPLPMPLTSPPMPPTSPRQNGRTPNGSIPPPKGPPPLTRLPPKPLVILDMGSPSISRSPSLASPPQEMGTPKRDDESDHFFVKGSLLAKDSIGTGTCANGTGIKKGPVLNDLWFEKGSLLDQKETSENNPSLLERSSSRGRQKARENIIHGLSGSRERAQNRDPAHGGNTKENGTDDSGSAPQLPYGIVTAGLAKSLSLRKRPSQKRMVEVQPPGTVSTPSPLVNLSMPPEQSLSLKLRERNQKPLVVFDREKGY